MEDTIIFETIVPEFIGVENDEYRYKIKFQGFNTEVIVNPSSNEFILIITDEIAGYYGYKNADELLGSDEHLDAIIMMERERESYLGGIYSDYKLICKSLDMVKQ